MTLALDAAAQAWFDACRSEHFPPDRLVVGAHVTMFHALPGQLEMQAAACLGRICNDAAAFPVAIQGLRFLGRGVAYALSAPEAVRIRAEVAAEFAGSLTPQDRNRWSPHVTVQNKVAPETARRTMGLLGSLAGPFPITATGLALWRYRGGPWEHAASFPFHGDPGGRGHSRLDGGPC